MRIIFVGIHNKPGMKPLDSKTKTGKVIDRIIDQLKPLVCIKSNLFDRDYFPKGREEITKANYRWFFKYRPVINDIIVLLGNWTQMNFISGGARIIKLSHPASFMYRSKEQSERYILNAIEKIKESLTTKY